MHAIPHANLSNTAFDLDALSIRCDAVLVIRSFIDVRPTMIGHVICTLPEGATRTVTQRGVPGERQG
jgi:hypothetical protein